MDDCINLALENNLDIRIKDIDHKIAIEKQVQIRSGYDPVVTGSAGRTNKTTSGENPLYGRSNKTDSFSIGVSKRFLSSGGALSLEWKGEKTDTDSVFVTQFGSVNPSYETDVTLSYRQHRVICLLS